MKNWINKKGKRHFSSQNTRHTLKIAEICSLNVLNNTDKKKNNESSTFISKMFQNVK